jgi:RNA 2',3'-cyclic 3'-phosphodiesterase
MGETWRTFVAIRISDELRATLAGAAEDWRGRPDLAGLRWIDPGAWHLTVAFIGATDPARVDEIVSALDRAAAAHEMMTLEGGGLGGFPSAGRARVAWYGISDGGGRLHRLALDVSSAAGIDVPSRFRAHLTLARARDEPVDLRAWIAEADIPAGRFDVDRLELMRSHLGRGPAHYETLASVKLGARVHA